MAKIIFEKDFARHPLHYFTLLCVMLVGLWGVLWFSYHPPTQLILMVAMAASYVVWGILHHHQHRDLHLKIVLEYLLLATLGSLIFASLVLRT